MAVPGGGGWLVVPPAGIARTAGFVDYRRRLRRQALAALVAEALGPKFEPRLVAGPDGVRRLAGTDWFASVAERDGWAAAAVARVPVGVDIESVAGAAVAAEAVAAAVTGSPCVDAAECWVSREAVLKAVGRDLTRDPGGWRFEARVSASGIEPHRVEIVALEGMVAGLAYVGG